MFDKNKTYNSHFFKDLKEIGNQSKNFAKKSQEIGTNFTKLPWNKLPAKGWFYIIFMLLVIIVMAVFIVPNISI